MGKGTGKEWDRTESLTILQFEDWFKLHRNEIDQYIRTSEPAEILHPNLETLDIWESQEINNVKDHP